MVGHPRIASAEMGFYSHRCPVLEFLLDVHGGTLRLKSERMPAEINRGAAIRPGWNVELLPKARQWIAGVHLGGEAGGSFESDRSHLDSWQRSQLLLH